MKIIKANFKGFYFFDWEIELLKKIGFEFPKLKKVSRLKCSPFEICTFKAIENPAPIELTQERKELVYQLRFQMNDINIINDSDETGFRQIEIINSKEKF